MSIQTDVIAGLTGVVLIFSAFFYGEYKESKVCNLPVLTATVKEATKNDKIDKRVMQIPATQLDRCLSYFMRD